MAIPKIIHYCWFGRGDKPEIIKKCISTWEKLEGYEVIEWNEDNFDINSHVFVKEAYKKKKYAFVSDYVRLKVLYEYGGIYLDTDVEIKKDFKIFLDHKFFIGFMYDCLLGTAVIGSEKNCPLVLKLIKEYDSFILEDNPNNNLFTQFFLNEYREFRLNNKIQNIGDGIVIYPKEYFERPTFNRKMGYSEHHYSATWKKREKKAILKNLMKLVLGNVLYKKLTHYSALKKTPFYEIYLQHRR